ncbi:MAG: DUF4126 domain-containing protein [Deltaproteobacteria bacterium]
METILSIAVGIGLAAACGFRVFVPLLMLGIAASSGYLVLPSGFAWMGGLYAVLAFATATVAEIIGYYVPWFDHALDTIATPAAVIAGTLTTAAMATDMSPFLKWTMALIAGGGIAGLVQASTVALRAKSLLTTGGAGNPVFSTLELAGAVIMALVAIFVPVIVIVLIVIFCVWGLRRAVRFFSGKTGAKAQRE